MENPSAAWCFCKNFRRVLEDRPNIDRVNLLVDGEWVQIWKRCCHVLYITQDVLCTCASVNLPARVTNKPARETERDWLACAGCTQWHVILAPESDRLSSDTTAFIVLCQFVKPSGKTRFDFAPHGRRLLALSFRREEIVVEPNLSLHTPYFFFAEQRVCVCVSAKSLALWNSFNCDSETFAVCEQMHYAAVPLGYTGNVRLDGKYCPKLIRYTHSKSQAKLFSFWWVLRRRLKISYFTLNTPFKFHDSWFSVTNFSSITYLKFSHR